ncbi:putative alpha/beta hydrolase [Aspergillus steynii IBT 23096]|uniref:Putative alpha/beta hydrolase n=1 Tax=Aspergillus steynii IBT 23096 TaxID=1392250 RepID=A0A2I2GHV5_9EURO|nr:putative alpha/beta hydrolase [Aspergillus steynii IBT 23096]PLB52465.1 putative alpha/beta hydrolase [Aspergillus steynii IBT 23096]
MVDLNQLLAITPAPLLAALTAAIFLALYEHLRHFRKTIQHLPEEPKAGVNIDHEQQPTELPYPVHVFPGGRKIRTVYGMIQVFEWGPETGEKVLLVHGLGTPCIALGDMAKEFVRRGNRVMLFDLFGRGYSETPNDLPHDARLYTTQILLVLSSSPLSWTGSSAFHIVGFSLGGSIAVAFAAYHATMLRSITVICPGGLIRPSHISRRSQVLYSSRFIPEWLRLRLLRRDLEPSTGAPSADVPDAAQGADMDFDAVPISADRPQVRIGDVIRWQLRANPGFVPSYLSTIRGCLVYRRHDHDRMWEALRDELARRRTSDAPPGLPGGRACLILADRDVIVMKDEFLEDLQGLLSAEDVDEHVITGGHEIGVLRGKDVASIAVESWK